PPAVQARWPTLPTCLTRPMWTAHWPPACSIPVPSRFRNSNPSCASNRSRCVMSIDMSALPALDWATVDGLVPVIVQDASNLRVLMLGYMDQAALEMTCDSGKVTFFSRTKQRLWMKGESSENYLNVVDIKVDCDNDTLLVLANPDGPTCHKGTASCFPAAPGNF